MISVALKGVRDSLLYIGDCLEALPGIPDGSVDVCVTSPPYNIGVHYSSYSDDLSRGNYLSWIGQVSRELLRVVSDRGSLFLNIGFTSTDPWIDVEIAQVFRRGWVLQNRIAWVKSLYTGERTIGHFKPINSARFLNRTFEHILHFTKAGDVAIDRLAIGVPYEDKSNLSRFGHENDLRCRGNVWVLPYETIQDRARQRGGHPATFPMKLPRMCIELHGIERVRKVLDPFNGIGSTLLAALGLGVESIGIELDLDYACEALEWMINACDAIPVKKLGAVTDAEPGRAGTTREA
jgi:site-specific DNA-methyltransferase (adenine-specific)